MVDQGVKLIRSQRGLAAKLTRELGLTSTGTISQWKKVPAERCHQIERLTGIPRHLLRPDLFEPPSDKKSETEAA